MDPMSIAQIANPFIQTIFIVVMGLGYFFTIRNLRSQVQEMNQARTTGGRPLIILTEDYENLPTINLVIQNVGYGPAKTSRLSSPLRWRARTASCSLTRPFLRRG
jgi:hypothetical protein